MAQPVTAIFFDFDGVLVDSARLKTAAYLALFPDRPAPVREQIRAYSDYHGGVPRWDKLRHIYEHLLHEPLPAERLDALCAQFAQEVVARVLAAPWIPGAQEFLLNHHRRYLLFVVSGTPHEEINLICQQRGIARLFQAIGGSPTSKPAWIRAFCQRHGLAPADGVFVGDSITDLRAAEQTGVPFIGVGTAGSGLLPPETDLIADLRELPARLERPTRPKPQSCSP